MNEHSDGDTKRVPVKSENVAAADAPKGGDNVGSNSNENASRPIKMVESSAQKTASAAETKSEKTKPPDKSNSDKRYDSRERPQYRGVNGIKPSPGGRGRREDDRRPSPNKFSRKEASKGGSSGSYRGRDTEVKKNEPSKPFSDESRLSKLVRRLQRESERDRRLTAAKNLHEYIYTVEGAKWALRSGEDLLAVLKDILSERGYKDVKTEVAGCIGLMGSLMGTDGQRYFQWIFGQINGPIADDVRALFLQALQETLKCDEKKQATAEFIPLVLNQLQTLLENADTPELLMSVVNVILQLTRVYPHIFSDYFRDTVDILVGWHIDASQKDQVIDFTSQSLISFHQFWVSDQMFTQELLGQFLEDMEAYAEDLGAGMPPHDPKLTLMPEEVMKIGSLLNVFTTVIKGLGDTFEPLKSHHLPLEYFVEIFDKILMSVDIAVKSFFSEYAVITANQCVMLMLSLIKTEAINCHQYLLMYVTTALFPHCRVSFKYIVSTLKLTKKVIDMFGTQFPVSELTLFLSSGSLLQSSKHANSPEVLKELTTVYQAVLGLKDIPLLGECYRFILGDIQQSVNILLDSAPGDDQLDLVSSNPFHGHKYNKREAEAVCIFNLSILGEIGNMKNNVIGMWALSPSLFDLYNRLLETSRSTVSLQYPALQYAVVLSQYSHASRHGNFISTSSLLTANTPLEGSVLAKVNPTTSGHFSILLKLLTDLLTHTNTAYDSKLLALKWVTEIIGQLHSSQHVYTTRQFLTLVQALYHVGYDHEETVAMATQLCLASFFKTPKHYPGYIVKGCVKLCMFHISEGQGRLADAYLALFNLLPVNITASKNNGLYLLEEDTQLVYSEETNGLPALWQACRQHAAKVPLGSFHSHSFRHVMSFILQGIESKTTGGLAWLESMFQSAQRPASRAEWKSADSVTMSNYVSGSTCAQWFWATWEAAQFCVLARLRTPLGKPQDTFTSIEGVLKKFAADVRHPQGEDEEGRKRNPSGSESGSQRDRHLRVKLLLQFMENLEKQLYNAYEGAAVSMANLPKAVRTFFRNNKNTCQEWVSRIRMFVIVVGLHCGMYTVVVRHASEMLHDMKALENLQSSEIELVLPYLVQALCELGDADAVQGVYAWCETVFGRKISWIKAAVEKAYGRYETAARVYRNAVSSLLQEEGEEEVGPREPSTSGRITGIMSKLAPDHNSGASPVHVLKVNMFVNEVMDCYVQLNDWESALGWQEAYTTMRAESSLNVGQPTYNVDFCLIKALSSFDTGDTAGVTEQLELIPALSDLGHWGLKDKEQWVQAQFLQAAAIVQKHTINNHKSDILKILNSAEQMGESLLKLQSLDWPVLVSHDTVSLLAAVSTLKSHVGDKRGKTWLLPSSDKLALNESDHTLYTFLQAGKLIRLQQSISNDKKLELSEQLFQIQLGTASLARKQHNHQLAERVLMRQAGLLLRQQVENGVTMETPDNLKAAMKLLKGGNTPPVNRLDIIRMERESAKLARCTNEQREAVELLTGSVAGYSCSDKSRTAICSELCARSLLTIVKWLQGDHKLLSSLAASKSGQGDSQCGIRHNLNMLLELEEKGAGQNQYLLMLAESSADVKIGDHPILADTDRIIGRLLHLSTIQCDTLPKAWYSLAGWCYKWGRKAIDNASHGSVELLEEESRQIDTLIPQGISEDEKESILTILSQIHAVNTSEEDISDQDQSQYDDGTETTRRQLVATCPALVTEESSVEGLLEVWRGIVHRIYHYYQLSAKSYFKFLKLNGGSDPLREKNNEDWNVISTLRVLRLLVKHAWELRNVLEDGLAATPTGPWKGIIPQLFSRLSHPEAYVRQSISELLCRVAEDAPHLIVYPAVVGSSSPKLDTKSETGLLNNYLTETPDGEPGIEHGEDAASQEEEDARSDIEDDSMLHSCIKAMLNTLATNFPQMICDVKQLIEELRRITLLWDELWLGTLSQQHQDVERRITQLENEIKKVNNNTALSKEEKMAIIREKHKTILKPTVYTMERLHDITSQPTATPHEKWFQDTFGSLITNALEKLRNPPNPNHPRASWHPFKQIHVSLQQRAQKRSSLMLSMSEISPSLHALRNTVIAMPGLGTIGQLVTIEAVSNTVQILPTKTKPKKLVFKGSDGKRYTYLFKGLEDLHLDERIMQFLNIVNNMFASANKGSHELYRARHYSVTPLGPRSGLIQWVDGVTPLFALYKRWQQREAVVQLMKQQAAGTSASSAQPNIPRPSEVYYNKLTPALREKGIKDLDNRKDWPLSVQRKVLEELMSETPRDLLAKELWCASTGPNEWWYVTQTYARSTAVMSMIGYIIGLGDRHLDNVLVDLSSGEVVHIDHNVCFEKGKGLRVPERVPFRLTQNIEAALGITGIEGKFRLASEHVMKTLRKGRETLLTLLEAFVYDPLVDWTTGNEGGYTGSFYGGGLNTGASALENRQSKLEMEKEITTSMFSIRVAEMKATWLQNRDELVSVLPRVQGLLDTRNSQVEEYSKCSEEEKRLEELKQLTMEAQASPGTSNIFTLHDRYKEYLVIKTTQDSVNKLVEEKINECVHWQQKHQYVMQKIQGTAFQKMCADIAKALNLGTPSFAAAKDFLQGAGQGSVVSQCEQVESELTSNLQLQRSNLHRVIDVLHSYGTIVSQFGVSFADNTRTTNYLHWLQELVSDFTEERCMEIVNHFHDMYGEATFPQSKIQLVLNSDMKLQTIISDANSRLMKFLERRALEKSDINLLKMQVQESSTSIDSFVTENGESGKSSLTAVIVTVLCALNKRNLQMEAAAAGAGDRLMDLTSRDGDWFLEELCSMSGNVSQFLDMIKACQQTEHNEQFSVLFKGMGATHHVYMALQDLNVNYRTIILPEALKIIQSQDPSVFTVLSKLETILTETGQPLDSLISQLEILHRNAVMGIKNENTELVGHIVSIRHQFLQLLESGDGGRDLTPGQMLLMCFNGLFTSLDDEFSLLMDCLDKMVVPEIWKKVDVIREARSMQLSSFTVNTRGILCSLFFIRRLQVMQEFFHMCTQFAAAVQGLEGGNCYDEEQLSRPVKHFIADYVRKQIIGFPSQILGYILCKTIHVMGLDVTAEIELKDVGAESKVPLEDLCKKAMDLCLRTGHFQQVHFTQASTLTTAQDATWRRHDLTRRLDSNIELVRSSVQRAQLHLTRLHWLHEDLFIQAGKQSTHMIANRATVMSEIKKCMQALVSQETSLVACQSQYTQLEASITQRLKWAAGANPSLTQILTQFEDASLVRKQLAEDESIHSQEVISLCQAILHLEAVRTRTPEAMGSDTTFLSLINKCTESCMLTSSARCSVSDLEVHLISIKSLADGEKTDAAWVKSALKEVTGKLKETGKHLLTLKTSIDESKDGIKSEVSNIKALLTTHHKLMSEIRAILKSLAKQEEQDWGETVNSGGVRDYLNLYKKFSENLTMALKMMISDDFTPESLKETKILLDALHLQIPQIYEDLIGLAPPLISFSEELERTSPLNFATALKKSSNTDEALRRPSLLHRDVSGTPPQGSPQMLLRTSISTPVKKLEKISRDPKTGKAIQERNSYAVGVWRRVKMKLDGRDPDQNKRLSVAEQVDYVIKDATNLDNLAVLYEGWTPWV